jgi:hypothetical protein
MRTVSTGFSLSNLHNQRRIPCVRKEGGVNRASPELSQVWESLLDNIDIPCRINYMPHGSTVVFSVVARLAFACLFQVNAYRGLLRYPGWCSNTTPGFLYLVIPWFSCP